MKFIFLNVPIEDLILAYRAAKWIAERDNKDVILAYGEEGKEQKHFYAKRNKSSITIRPC